MGAISRKRNINIEVLRICSAWLVILTHVLNKNYTDGAGQIRDKVCLLNTICIVAVPCFFMVAGYFASRGQSIARKLRHVGLSVVVPSLIVIFLYQALWACHQRGIAGPKRESGRLWGHLDPLHHLEHQ